MTLTSLASTQSGTPGIPQSIRGTWQVYDGHWGDSEIWFVHIGELEIADTTYSFTPDSNAFISPQMSERFSFICKPEGCITIQNIEGAGPKHSIEDENILMKISFNDGECFLIRADYEEALLYFHSSVSEVQLFRIVKSLKNE